MGYFNSYWRNQFRQFTPEEIKTLSSSLGNLLPLSQSINSSLQNDPFEDKKVRGYTNGSHSEIEVSKESDWDAIRIYHRGIKMLHFMEKRWGFEYESQEQIDELLHIAFVKDGREIPQEIPLPEDDGSADAQEIHTDNLDEIKTAYWRFALPQIQEAQGGEGRPYANVKPTAANYKDGYFGVPGIHLYCGITSKKHKASVGLWIDTGEKKSNKAIYDVIYNHKNTIDAKMSMPLNWNRNDEKQSCGIYILLPGVDYKNTDDWPAIAQFQAKMLKELADYAFYPYQNEIISAMR